MEKNHHVEILKSGVYRACVEFGEKKKKKSEILVRFVERLRLVV